MKTIVTPACSQASITSASRLEPPGWITTVGARVDRRLRTVGEREERVGGDDRSPSSTLVGPSPKASAHFSIASRTESTRLICPAPIPTVAPSLTSTIAFERTCLQTFQANAMSRHFSSLGSARLDRHPLAVAATRPLLDQHPAADPLHVDLAAAMALLGVLEDPDRLLLLEDLHRPALVAGRDQDLDEVLVQPLRERLVDRPVQRDHAAVGGQRVARERLLVGVERALALGHPARVVVLDDHAGRAARGRPAGCAPSRGRGRC